jgi:hypothetical protein
MLFLVLIYVQSVMEETNIIVNISTIYGFENSK